jgi:transcriptional regulator with XRE-family HTH domain
MTTPTSKKTGGPPRRHNDQDPARTGATLRQLRVDKDVSQADLAKACGFIHAQSIAQIEAGYRALTDGKLIKAARFLDVQPLAIRRPEPGATEHDK